MDVEAAKVEQAVAASGETSIKLVTPRQHKQMSSLHPSTDNDAAHPATEGAASEPTNDNGLTITTNTAVTSEASPMASPTAPNGRRGSTTVIHSSKPKSATASSSSPVGATAGPKRIIIQRDSQLMANPHTIHSGTTGAMAEAAATQSKSRPNYTAPTVASAASHTPSRGKPAAAAAPTGAVSATAGGSTRASRFAAVAAALNRTGASGTNNTRIVKKMALSGQRFVSPTSPQQQQQQYADPNTAASAPAGAPAQTEESTASAGRSTGTRRTLASMSRRTQTRVATALPCVVTTEEPLEQPQRRSATPTPGATAADLAIETASNNVVYVPRPNSPTPCSSSHRVTQTPKQQVQSRPTSAASYPAVTRSSVALRMTELTNPSEPYKLNLPRTQQQKVLSKRSRQPRKIANVYLSKYSVVRKVAEEMGFDVQETEDEFNSYLFNLCWSDTVLPLTRLVRIGNWQRTNHFPAMYLICRKGHLTMTIGRMRRQLPTHFSFYPHTWTMRTERAQFMRYLTALKQKKISKFFIVKPNAGCQGRGIVVTRDPIASIEDLDNYIVQEYVPRPLLIEDRKFDLRVYVLLTSIREPSIFVFNDGLVRLCAEVYEYPTDANAKNTCKHLTNYALNKHSTEYVFNTDAEHGDIGNKRNFKFFNRWLEERGHNTAVFWGRVGFLITKTILAAQPQIAQVYNSCFPRGNDGYTCFEVLGFDILVDSKLKPWLIEVNHTPSFGTDTPLDYDIKSKLLMETWDILDCKANDYDLNRLREREEFTRRNMPPWANNHPLYQIQMKPASPTVVNNCRSSFSSFPPLPHEGSGNGGQSAGEDLQQHDEIQSNTPPSFVPREVSEEVKERRAREDSKLKNFTRVFPSANPEYQLVYNAIRTFAQAGVSERLGGPGNNNRVPGAGSAESNALQQQLINTDRLRRETPGGSTFISVNPTQSRTPRSGPSSSRSGRKNYIAGTGAPRTPVASVPAPAVTTPRPSSSTVGGSTTPTVPTGAAVPVAATAAAAEAVQHDENEKGEMGAEVPQDRLSSTRPSDSGIMSTSKASMSEASPGSSVTEAATAATTKIAVPPVESDQVRPVMQKRRKSSAPASPTTSARSNASKAAATASSTVTSGEQTKALTPNKMAPLIIVPPIIGVQAVVEARTSVSPRHGSCDHHEGRPSHTATTNASDEVDLGHHDDASGMQRVSSYEIMMNEGPTEEELEHLASLQMQLDYAEGADPQPDDDESYDLDA